MRNMTHSCSFICVTWLIHMCDTTHSYVWHDSFIHVTWPFIYVTWLIHICDMTHSYMWHDSFICVTWLIHMCGVSHSYMWRDSLQLPFCVHLETHIYTHRTHVYINMHKYFYFYTHKHTHTHTAPAPLRTPFPAPRPCASYHLLVPPATSRGKQDPLCVLPTPRLQTPFGQLWFAALLFPHASRVWPVSCHTCGWVMSHIWMSHVTHMKESYHTYEWVMSHIWMSHVWHDALMHI